MSWQNRTRICCPSGDSQGLVETSRVTEPQESEQIRGRLCWPGGQTSHIFLTRKKPESWFLTRKLRGLEVSWLRVEPRGFIDSFSAYLLGIRCLRNCAGIGKKVFRLQELTEETNKKQLILTHDPSMVQVSGEPDPWGVEAGLNPE